MKILVLSLLRMGDVILHAEMIPAMKKAYPQAEIHFLVNQSFSQAQEIIPEVSRWHFLDRSFIEKVLVEQNQSPRAAFDSLKSLVQTLNQVKFDLILNATHNLLSVRIMDLLQAKEKRGAAFQDGKKAPFANSWLSYFNDHYSELAGSRFHYLEILHKALDLPLLPARRQKIRSQGTIYLQVLTADSKKNWGLENFLKLKKSLGPDVTVICSPAEKEQVQKYFTDSEIISPSLAEAQELFKKAQLLITGDTSIQHLAVRAGCPVVALFIGSADPVKTAPWLVNPVIIQGSAVCQPCRASLSCSQASHLCGESISVDQVQKTVHDFLAGRSSIVAPEDQELAVWRTYLDQTAYPMDYEFKADAIDRHLQELALKIETISKVIFGNVNKIDAQSAAQEIKNDIQQLQRKFPEIKDSFFKLNQSFQVLDHSFFEFLKMLRAGMKETLSLQQIRKHLAHRQEIFKSSSEVPLE